MKTITNILLGLILLAPISLLRAQTDKGFSYQAVARDNGGTAIANSPINLRFQIREGSSAGTIAYQETHAPSTNDYGLFQAVIGKGTGEIGDFASIDWSSNDFFLVVEINGAGVDTSLLEGVPYAKVATDMSIGALNDVNISGANSGEVLKWNGSEWAPGSDDGGISYTAGTGIDINGGLISNTAPDQVVSLSGSGATSVSGSYPNFTVSSTDNVDDADASPTNEIQQLSLSGSTLNLSLGGGSANLSSLTSPWNTTGSNLYYNSGNVGIGDNSPIATLTVGNGDKLQINGSDGDVVFNDDQGSLRFSNTTGANQPMIQMFSSGTNNSTRMVIAHSPNFPSWGIRYNDTSDAFTWIGDNIPVMHLQLAGQQRIGIGTDEPETKFHVYTNSATGFGQIKLTETQLDYSRITMNNDVHSNFWDIAARTDTNLANANFNLYHSDVGDVFTVNARGRVGINDATPSYTLDIAGNESSRVINVSNNLPTTTNTTYNYGVRANLSQATNTGFPRLYNFYGISTDNDAYLSYGMYAYASGASNNNYGVYCFAPTSSGYALYASGNTYATGSYQTSDARFKKDVEDIASGMETLRQLKPKTYTYDTRQYEFMNLPQETQYGFLAQDLKQVLPELTQETFQPYEEALSDTEEGQGMWFEAVNYIGLIPIMVAGMQEQQAVIDSQQQEIDDLKARIEKLEALIGN